MDREGRPDLGIAPEVAPSGTGCVECLKTGGWWLHLRRCTACGHIGCCDTSPSQHATGHWKATGHRVMTSFEPGETWFWDYSQEQVVPPVPLVGPQHPPAEQPSPGPFGLVPVDWMSQLHS